MTMCKTAKFYYICQDSEVGSFLRQETRLRTQETSNGQPYLGMNKPETSNQQPET